MFTFLQKYKYVYDEEDKLGEGSFGVVYRGYDLKTFEQLAIKKINF